jgi:hypothetical protein
MHVVVKQFNFSDPSVMLVSMPRIISDRRGERPVGCISRRQITRTGQLTLLNSQKPRTMS